MIWTSDDDAIGTRPFGVGRLNRFARKFQAADPISLKRLPRKCFIEKIRRKTNVANVPNVETVVEKKKSSKVSFSRRETNFSDEAALRVVKSSSKREKKRKSLVGRRFRRTYFVSVECWEFEWRRRRRPTEENLLWALKEERKTFSFRFLVDFSFSSST